MADQLYEEVVLELSFNIENPEAIPASASFDDTFGLSRDMLNRALAEYLDVWRGQTRLLPKQGAGRTSSQIAGFEPVVSLSARPVFCEESQAARFQKIS